MSCFPSEPSSTHPIWSREINSSTYSPSHGQLYQQDLDQENQNQEWCKQEQEQEQKEKKKQKEQVQEQKKVLRVGMLSSAEPPLAIRPRMPQSLF